MSAWSKKHGCQQSLLEDFRNSSCSAHSPETVATLSMFKRILSALSGKKSPAPAETRVRHSDAAAPELNEGELITVYDSHGREIKITRNEWRDKVFLPNLQQQWGSADELYSLIVSGEPPRV
ncbi:Tetratricopeptide-like helical domain-containing protein, partial [Pseudomonas savastanoi]